MAIPRIETNMVELANLQPGVRYNFRTNDNPDNISEGTFTRFIAPSPANDGNAQYFFSNYVLYNPQGRLITKSRMINYADPNDYPRDIFVYDLTNLPSELNKHITSFGGKSRKTKRRNNKKSKRRRYNRKSKRR